MGQEKPEEEKPKSIINLDMPSTPILLHQVRHSPTKWSTARLTPNNEEIDLSKFDVV